MGEYSALGVRGCAVQGPMLLKSVLEIASF